MYPIGKKLNKKYKNYDKNIINLDWLRSYQTKTNLVMEFFNK
jgi:hypothetical protein